MWPKLFVGRYNALRPETQFACITRNCWSSKVMLISVLVIIIYFLLLLIHNIDHDTFLFCLFLFLFLFFASNGNSEKNTSPRRDSDPRPSVI